MSHKTVKEWFIIMLLIVRGSGSRVIHRLKEHDKCPFKQGFPQSSCIITSNCMTLPLYLERRDFTISQVDSCGFRDAYNELICCPDQPLQIYQLSTPSVVAARPFSRTTATPLVNINFNSSHLVSLTYLNEHHDEFIYRCTAAILDDKLVVASSKCASIGFGRPMRILLGVQDPNSAFNKSAQIELKTNSKKFQNELILFELNKSIETIKNSVHVSLIEICSPEDLKYYQKIQAVGFSQDEAEVNCAQFVTDLQIVGYKACSQLEPQYRLGPIFDTYLVSTHLCLLPVTSRRSAHRCKNCLTSSSSVLHVVRENGSICMAGIATPSNACNEHGNRVTFTNFMSDEVSDFFNSHSFSRDILFRTSQ